MATTDLCTLADWYVQCLEALQQNAYSKPAVLRSGGPQLFVYKANHMLTLVGGTIPLPLVVLLASLPVGLVVCM